jgi:hypothetical protein
MLLVSFTPLPSYALDYYWVGGNGYWEDPTRWSLSEGGSGGTGPPTNNSDVFLIQPSSGDLAITHVPQGHYIGKFTLDATGGGVATLSISEGNFPGFTFFDVALIGQNGTAIINQSGGLIEVVFSFLYQNATYNLSRGTIECYGLV